MRRLLIAVMMLMAAGQAVAGDFIVFPGFPTRGQGPFDKAEWWRSGLTFYAPFDSPSDPLRLIKGTGSLSFTRATSATYVHPTTGLITAAASGALRIESNGALIEGQRTNLALQSEALGGTPWSLARVTVDNNVMLAPDGTLTAEKITCDGTATNTHAIYQGGITYTDNVPYTTSIFLKKGAGTFSTWAAIRNSSKDGTEAHAYVNLDTCSIGSVVGTGATGRVTPYDNGWCRIWVSDNVATGAGSPTISVYMAEADNDKIFSGDSASYIYAWGVSSENNASFPSSYIPTTTAAVTRNADVLSVPNSGNFNAYTGTVAFTYNPNQLTSTGYAWSAKTYFSVAYISGGTSYRITEGTNIGTYATKSISSIGTDYKLAHSYGGTSFKATIDGGAVEEDTFAGEYPLATNFYFGNDGSGNPSLYGHLKNFRMWNRAFTDAELQSITR